MPPFVFLVGVLHLMDRKQRRSDCEEPGGEGLPFAKRTKLSANLPQRLIFGKKRADPRAEGDRNQQPKSTIDQITVLRLHPARSLHSPARIAQ
ncbi:MAG: hypothetical protein EA385_15760 [Salinarimonadaceae bacterium]|nr:MAG: hypothetical protein EA385_15760 [Salinarimonadaceae bacterium]